MFRMLMICFALMAAVALAVAVASADEPAALKAATHRAASTARVSHVRVRAKKRVPAPADEARKSQETGGAHAPPTGDVKMSGMSILGNEDAPKSLVIVPWKSAEIGKMPGLSMLLDDAVRPVDKDVFMRELAYYQVRAGGN